MSSSEIADYIKIRNGELGNDEILEMIDISKNPQIDHISYENSVWNMWDNTGMHFTFHKRNWN